MAASSSHKAAENVASAFVRGHNAVCDKESGSARVVCDDTQGNVCFFVFLVVYACFFAYSGDDIAHGVYLKHIVYALHYASEALKAHTRVYILCGKLCIVAVAVIIELGENVIPDLHISVAIAAGAAVGAAAAVFFAAVEVYFGAGAAGAGAMLPEVVGFAETDDVFFLYADLIFPDVICFVVFLVNGRPEKVAGDFERFCKEFPSPFESFFLEVIAKREVAEHFEERAVARREADMLYIVCADALLAGCHTSAGGLCLAREIFFKGSHARNYKKERFIAFGYKGIASAAQMPFGFEERKVFCAQVVKRCPLHDF